MHRTFVGDTLRLVHVHIKKEHKMQTRTGVTVKVSGEDILAPTISVTGPYWKLLLVFTMYC